MMDSYENGFPFTLMSDEGSDLTRALAQFVGPILAPVPALSFC